MISFLFALSACVGRLSDPATFFDADLAFPCELDDQQVLTDIITPKCLTSGCHNSITTAAALDLEAPDAPSRLLGAPSSCGDKPLLDAETPFAGYIFEKLAEKPSCGAQMPPVGHPLSEPEISCLHRLFGRPWADAATATEGSL
jgi:hypothetical protein